MAGVHPFIEIGLRFVEITGFLVSQYDTNTGLLVVNTDGSFLLPISYTVRSIQEAPTVTRFINLVVGVEGNLSAAFFASFFQGNQRTQSCLIISPLF